LTLTTQAPDTVSAPAKPTPGRRLLKGGAKITEFIIKRKTDRQDIRWFYGQLPHFAGVVWRLTEDGALLAWTGELTEYLETKAAEAKASALAAAVAKAAEKEAVTEAARKAAQPAPARSRKTLISNEAVSKAPAAAQRHKTRGMRHTSLVDF
jgi:hypothetical protein